MSASSFRKTFLNYFHPWCSQSQQSAQCSFISSITLKLSRLLHIYSPACGYSCLQVQIQHFHMSGVELHSCKSTPILLWSWGVHTKYPWMMNDLHGNGLHGCMTCIESGAEKKKKKKKGGDAVFPSCSDLGLGDSHTTTTRELILCRKKHQGKNQVEQFIFA